MAEPRFPLASLDVQATDVTPTGKNMGALFISSEVTPKLSLADAEPRTTPMAPPGLLHSVVISRGAVTVGGSLSATVTMKTLNESTLPTTAFFTVSGLPDKLQQGSAARGSAVTSVHTPPIWCISRTSSSLAPSDATAASE